MYLNPTSQAACSCSTSSGYSSQSFSEECPYNSHSKRLQHVLVGNLSSATAASASSSVIMGADFTTVRTSTPTNRQKFVAASSISTISSLHSPAPHLFVSASTPDEENEIPKNKASGGVSSSSLILQFFMFIFTCFSFTWLFGSANQKKKKKKSRATDSANIFPMPRNTTPIVITQMCSTPNKYYYDERETYDNIPDNNNSKTMTMAMTTTTAQSCTSLNRAMRQQQCTESQQSFNSRSAFSSTVRLEQQPQQQQLVLNSNSLDKIYENLNLPPPSLPPPPPPPMPPHAPQSETYYGSSTHLNMFKVIKKNQHNHHSTPDDSMLNDSSPLSSPSSSSSSSLSFCTLTSNFNNHQSLQQFKSNLINKPLKQTNYGPADCSLMSCQEYLTTTSIPIKFTVVQPSNAGKPHCLSMINLNYQQPRMPHTAYYAKNLKPRNDLFTCSSQYVAAMKTMPQRYSYCQQEMLPPAPFYCDYDYMCDKEVESYFGDTVSDISNSALVSTVSLATAAVPAYSHATAATAATIKPPTPFRLSTPPNADIDDDMITSSSCSISSASSSSKVLAAASFLNYQKAPTFHSSSNVISIRQNSESYC